MRAAIAHGPRPAGRPRKPACRSCYDSRASDGQYDVRLECHQFGCILAHGCGIARAPAIVDADILPDGPTRLLQGLRESGQECVPFSIVCRKRCKDTDAPHAIGLLRPRRERPCGRPAEQRDELAASDHSITSSARASSMGGMARPSALAVVRLMMRSNLVGCSTGRLAGFAPRTILS